MGIDAVIHIRGIRNAQLLEELNERIGSVLFEQDRNEKYGNYFAFSDDFDDEAEFQTVWRYWGPGYERGPWFDISGVLMAAMGMTGMEVCYGGDTDEPELMTPERLAHYWQHFCGPNGNDYRGHFRTAQALLLRRNTQ
jgi:hypothetical protein